MINSLVLSRSKNLTTYIMSNYADFFRSSDNYDIAMSKIIDQHITACEVLFSLDLNAEEIIDTTRGLNYHKATILSVVMAM